MSATSGMLNSIPRRVDIGLQHACSEGAVSATNVDHFPNAGKAVKLSRGPYRPRARPLGPGPACSSACPARSAAPLTRPRRLFLQLGPWLSMPLATARHSRLAMCRRPNAPYRAGRGVKRSPPRACSLHGYTCSVAPGPPAVLLRIPVVE